MSAPVRIYLSANTADAGTAEGLEKHLRAAFAGHPLELRDRSSLYPGTDNALGGEAWLRWADLCIVVFSADYLSQDTSREWEMAKRLERERRPALQILIAYARSAAMPADFQAFPIAPGPSEPVQQPGFDRDRQLARVAHMARLLYDERGKGQPDDLLNEALGFPFAVRWMQAAASRLNLLPPLALLKKIAQDAALKKTAYEMEDLFGETLRQGKLAKIPLTEYLQRNETVREDYRFSLQHLQESDLAAGWRSAFLLTAASWQSPTAPLALFTPTDDISIPETLNLSVTSGEVQENVGSMSYQQKSDFRRELLLAQDALSVENYSRAHSHCERVRTQIDPQSAQLYEYLLLSFVQNETPVRIARDAVDDEKRRLLHHVVLYANRLREYQQSRQCPSQTGEYNLRATAEALSDALDRLYDQLPNDYLVDTGKRAAEMPDNRAIVSRCREVGEIIFRSVHSYTGFLETLVLELCGGGKYAWIQRVEISHDEFVFVSSQHFEIETSAAELVNLLSTATQDRSGVESRLSEALLLRLRAKRSRLHRYLAEEKRRYRKFNDPRESVIQFVQACLLGYNLFKNSPLPLNAGPAEASHLPRHRGEFFLRLALEYLMPALVLQPDPDAVEDLRWFDLDPAGQVVAHPDTARYAFDAFAVVEKIVRDYAGRTGWLRVGPNLRREVYLQYVADTDALYEQVRSGLQWTDFRRMTDLQARGMLVKCLRRWVVAYHAYPEQGQVFLDRCVEEITGHGLLNWLYFNPDELATHPDSLAFGYDARAELHTLCGYSIQHTEPLLARRIAERLYQQQVLPAYEALRRGEETQRGQVVGLLRQAFAAYRLSPDPRYLDFVFREMTEEVKFRWVNVGEDGQAKPWAFQSDQPWQALEVLAELQRIDPRAYACLTVRERVAERRHADQMERYLRDISEFRQENRRPERAIAIDILRKMRGIFLYYPRAEFLELPLRELQDKGRIRWNARFLGFFPTRENHYENQFYHFNYRLELYQLKQLLEQHYLYMEQVMRDCGVLG